MGCIGHNSTSDLDQKNKTNNKENIEIKKDSQKENEEKEKEIIIGESPLDKVEEIESEHEDVKQNEETEQKDFFDDFGSDLEEKNRFESFMKVPNLKKEFCMDFPEETKIYSVTEISNERIAILDNDKDLKIYSIKTFKLITKINQDYVKNFIELKNKDIVTCSSSKIYFYKLINNINYELYQTIDEAQQGTNITKFIENPFENQGYWDENYYCLNSIYELINNNLVSCNSYGIKYIKKT